MTIANPQYVIREALIDICQREAIVRVPYPDGKGHSQGVGNQWNYDLNRPVQYGDPIISVPRAIEWLKLAVAEREITLNRMLKVEITAHQFSALHSLFYQAGTDELREVAGLFNDRKPNLAMCAFAKFTKNAAGEDSEGIAYRRLCEILSGRFDIYIDQDRIPVYDSVPTKRNPDYFIEVKELDI